ASLREEILHVIAGWGREILDNPARYANRFYQGFILLNYCRMLHDLRRGYPGSKREGAEWAKSAFNSSWSPLIDRAWATRPDPAKGAANFKRHVVSFREAATVLDDPLSTTFADEAHSEAEARFLTVGASTRGHVLVVADTERNDTVRVISARRATRREREFYEQGKSTQR